jgi:hypothetical protein
LGNFNGADNDVDQPIIQKSTASGVAWARPFGGSAGTRGLATNFTVSIGECHHGSDSKGRRRKSPADASVQSDQLETSSPENQKTNQQKANTMKEKITAKAPKRRGTTNPQSSMGGTSSEALYIAQLKKLHREVIGHTRKTLKQVIRMGGILRRWKGQCRHGNWEKLVEDKLPFDVRTARNYMRCYDNREELLKTENVSDFGISEAYRNLPVLSKKSEATGNTSAATEENSAPHVPTKQEVISRLSRTLLQGLEELNC